MTWISLRRRSEGQMKTPNAKQLLAENAELRVRLNEAEQTLDAISHGEVDGIVVSGPRGKQIFSLVGAESIYRLIVETMKEAAFTVTFDGTILFCNAQFGQFVQRPMEQIVGHRLHQFVAPDNATSVDSLLIASSKQSVKQRLVLRNSQEQHVPVHISANTLNQPDGPSICVVATNLTELENSTDLIQQLRRQQEALRDSRIAALNLMKDAVETRQLTEQANENLRLEITDRKKAEEALRESEGRFRALTETSSLAVGVSSSDGKFLYLNRAYEKLFGYTLKELDHLNASELWRDPEDRRKMVDAVRSKGLLMDYEVKLKRKDGTPFWAMLSVNSVDYGGNQAIMATVYDITERKKAEEAVQQSEERLQLTLQASAVGTFEVDLTTGVGRWNAVEYELLGLKPGDVPAGPETFFHYVHPQDVAELRARWEEATRTGNLDAEFRVVRADGQERWLAGKGQFVFAETADAASAGGKRTPLRFLGVNFDITQRKQAEEAVAAAHGQVQSIIDNTTAIIYAFDLEERFVLANAALAKLLNSTPEQMIGKRRHEFMPKEDADWHEANDRQAIEAGKAMEFEERSQLQGRSITWLTTKFPLRDARGRIYAVAGISADVSERKKAEEALREWNATLESKVVERTAELRHRARQLQKMTLEVSLTEDRERKRMAEILHDDLQQIIAGAKFHLSLLKNRVKYDASLQAVATRIDDMLRDAIEKSRGLAHELSPAILRHGDFTETLDWLANQMRAKHGLAIHVQAHGSAEVQSDAVRTFLYKTAQELLFNVVKHARVKEAAVRMRRHGQCVCLSVSDRGRGFDPQKLRETTGFGLLSIRERIELLGGRMKIKSHKGKGSTLFIAVPDGEKSEDRRQTTVDRDAFAGPSSGSRLRVLLADDHRIVREGLRALLSDEPDVVVVGEAAHGREAVDMALRLKPDVVIMDVSMPLIDGDDATREIKEHLPKTRIIALSTYNEPGTMEKMYKAGAESYVHKTASSDELLAAIRG
jgi:PAS domain S-box-containing protein